MSDQSTAGGAVPAGYVDLELIGDPDEFIATAEEYLSSVIPGFVLRPGNVETVLLQANAQIGSEIVEQTSQFAPVVFAYLGQTLLGISIREGAPALGEATVTFAIDAPVGTLDQGSEMSVPAPDGNDQIFVTDDPIEIPEGGGQLVVGVTAAEEGIAGNGCYGLADLLDTTDGIDSVYVSTTSGGQDPEEDDDYLDRLSQAMTILAPRPILPTDFVTMALTVEGVGRALALDLYQPATTDAGYGQPRDTNRHTNVERCVTVTVMGEDGGFPSSALMQTTYQLLDANREVNFLVYVVPPGENGAPTPVDVKATIVPYPDRTPEDVLASAQAQLEEWLSPENYGTTEAGSVATLGWTFQDKVYLYEAVDYLNRAEGVFRVEGVQLKKSSDATWLTGDLQLGGVVPLPTLGTATLTIG